MIAALLLALQTAAASPPSRSAPLLVQGVSGETRIATEQPDGAQGLVKIEPPTGPAFAGQRRQRINGTQQARNSVVVIICRILRHQQRTSAADAGRGERSSCDGDGQAPR